MITFAKISSRYGDIADTKISSKYGDAIGETRSIVGVLKSEYRRRGHCNRGTVYRTWCRAVRRLGYRNKVHDCLIIGIGTRLYHRLEIVYRNRSIGVGCAIGVRRRSRIGIEVHS